MEMEAAGAQRPVAEAVVAHPLAVSAAVVMAALVLKESVEGAALPEELVASPLRVLPRDRPPDPIQMAQTLGEVDDPSRPIYPDPVPRFWTILQGRKIFRCVSSVWPWLCRVRHISPITRSSLLSDGSAKTSRNSSNWFMSRFLTSGGCRSMA